MLQLRWFSQSFRLVLAKILAKFIRRGFSVEAKKARTSPLHLVTGLLSLKNSRDRKKENTTQAQFTHALGTSGLNASPLGVGTNKWVYGQNDEQALQVFQSSLESGICFFDTAEVYRFGKSERLPGECLRQNKRQAVIASKFAPFPTRALEKALDASLARLRLQTLDLYFIHFPVGKIEALVDPKIGAQTCST